MVTGMLKLTMRQIRSSLTRFLAIAAIVALGVGFFCGLRLTKTAMVHTLNDYAEAHRMYDFRLVSTVGFDETDAEALAADARVAACEGEKSADALASVADGAAKPCRFLSLPEQIDLPGLKCGRFPQTAEECLADGLLYSEKDLGKTVVLTEENDEDTLDSFNRREFTIVGIAKSVLYINYERGGTSIGSGTLSSFVYILPEAFALEYDTSLYLRLAGRQGEVYSDEYTACIDAAEPWVTQLAESAAQQLQGAAAGGTLDRQGLLALPEPVCDRLLLRLLEQHGLPRSAAVLARMKETLRSGGKLDIAERAWYLIAEGSWAALSFQPPGGIPPVLVPFPLPQKVVILPFGRQKRIKLTLCNKIVAKQSEKFNISLLKNVVDCDKIIGNSVLRTRRPGDRIRTAKTGKPLPLGEAWAAAGIPASLRPALAVLADDNGVLWAEGLSSDSRAAVTEKTGQYVIIECQEEKTP